MGAIRTRAGRLPPDERRTAIIEAALPLVLRHGPAVTTRQIADAAGVVEGTVFRVFPDKDALMAAVVEQAFDPAPTLCELARVDRALPLRDRLVAAVQIMQRRLTGAFTLLDALRPAGPPPEHQGAGSPCRPAAPSTMNDAFRDAVVDLVGADRHLLRGSAVELAHVLRLLTFSATHPRISDGRPLPAEAIVAVLLDGLLAHPTED